MPSQLGETIRRARLLAGLSQDDLAEKLGVTRRTVGEWERTGKVSPYRRAELAKILEIGEDSEAGRATAGVGDPESVELTYRGRRFVVFLREGQTPEAAHKEAGAIFEAVMEKVAQLDRDRPK